MGNIGWTGILIIVIVVVLLFGRGKISSIMGDVAKGIKSFKKGMSSEDVDQSKNTPTEENPEENPEENSDHEKK
jgi:sec-independent protein translocase protein TatA